MMNKSNRKYFYLLFLCCSVLFFVNIKDSHDWGDDFAQYIHRAKNIVEKIPQHQTGYVFNERFPVYSPPAFTMGFPLLLSPFYFFFGNNIIAFNYLMSFFMTLFILLTYFLLYKKIKPVYAFLISLALLFNPLLINLKTEIISDVPFAVFLLLCTLFYSGSKKKLMQSVLLGLLAGFLISIRTVGFSFIIAVFINETILFFKSSEASRKKTWLISGAVFSITAGIFYYVLNYIFFHLSGDTIYSASTIFTFTHLSDIFFHNLNYEMNVWQNLLFSGEENRYAFISTLARSVLLSGVVWGFIIRIKKSFSFTEIFVIVYMLVILIYPYSCPGFRFLIPLIPFFMIYFYEWLKVIYNSLNFSKFTFVVFVMLSVFLLYKYDWQKMLDSQNLITEGPQRLYAKEIISYISENTMEKERIIFSKPMVLALYTGRESFAVNPADEPEIIREQIKSHNLDYILTCKSLPDPALEKYIESDSANIILLKANDFFSFYKIKKISY